MTERVQMMKAPGLPCPECTTPIVVEPTVLLSAAPISCPGCGLELQVNVEQSKGALDALSNYMRDFDAAQNKIMGNPGFRSSRKPGRRARRLRRSEA